MSKIEKYKWNPPKWLKNPVQANVIFHDIHVEVYLGRVNIEEIRLWRGNDRTLLDIDHIKSELRKEENQLSDNEILSFILQQGLHKISDLAKSIKENGVRIPLVLTFNKELLDGNRRFLACQYLLRREKEKLSTFIDIPAYCVRPNIGDDLRLKIISEMNFLPDFKEEWPREVRAKFVVDNYYKFKKEFGEEKALQKIAYELKVNNSDVGRFIYVLGMIKEYVNLQKDVLQHKKAEIFARDNFHFFEEFYNKAIHGKDLRSEARRIEDDKNVFFDYLMNNQLNSTTKIRDLAYMLQVPEAKKILKASTDNFDDAKAVFEELKLSNKASIRIERFCNWLEGLSKSKRNEISSSLKTRLIKVAIRFGK
jgi:hypothetical protein